MNTIGEKIWNWLTAQETMLLSSPVAVENLPTGFSSTAWQLEEPIFKLPTGDTWTIADACQGVLVLGATGSGKSSGSADALARKFLNLGAGGLVLCVKTGEADYWQELARLCGRENDILRITEKDHGFNVFDYELRRCGRGAGLTMNLVFLFRQLQDLVDAKGGSKMSPDFWERACIRCISNAIALQAALDEPFTLMGVSSIISSAPRVLGMVKNADWQSKSPCARACKNALEKTPNDFEIQRAVQYFLVDVPQMGDKQRAGIFETWEGLADPLLRTPLRQKFCEQTTWTPEDAIQNGKIIVIDLPVKEFDFAGKMAGVISKFMFQKAVERRLVGDEKTRRPCFVWADEFENFATSYDNMFQKTARSSKASTVYIGQNIPGILACLGGTSGDPYMKALLGNLTTQIFHANAEEGTNRYAAEAIGKDWQLRRSLSAGESHQRLAPAFSGSSSSNASMNEQLDYLVQPIEFTQLKTGGSRNERIVECFFFQASRTFNDGYNFVPGYFTQRERKP